MRTRPNDGHINEDVQIDLGLVQEHVEKQAKYRHLPVCNRLDNMPHFEVFFFANRRVVVF
jgi:hypothetical protein